MSSLAPTAMEVDGGVASTVTQRAAGETRGGAPAGSVAFQHPALPVQPLVHLALVVVQLLFASLAIAGRFVLPHFPAGALVTARVLGATLVLLALNTIIGGPWVRDRRDLLRLAILGMLGIAANQTLFLYGLRQTTAIN